jgi:two-component system, NarL family, invasion response regulator UvrY
LIRQHILIADDHGMIRRGLSMLIQNEIGEFVIGEADTLTSVMTQLRKEYYSHLILDLIFADGNALEILPNIYKLYPSLKVLIFSMQPAAAHAEAFRSLKIAYYLSKTADNDTVIKILNGFLNNYKILQEVTESASGINPFKDLTARELQILHYMLNGLGTKQISETLNLKMNSVSTLKKRIHEKTGTNSFKALIDLCTLYKINF